MSTEMQMLVFSILLGIVQLFVAARFMTRQRGLQWNMGPRDKKGSELTGVAGRLQRAFENFKETFPFFLGAVMCVSVMKVSTPMSVAGAQMYFFARVIYVPLYIFGVTVARTICWFVALGGIFMVLSALI